MRRERSAGPPAPSAGVRGQAAQQGLRGVGREHTGHRGQGQGVAGKSGDTETMLLEAGNQLQQAETLRGSELEEDRRQKMLHRGPLGGQRAVVTARKECAQWATC